jgi:hypothetical protein
VELACRFLFSVDGKSRNRSMSGLCTSEFRADYGQCGSYLAEELGVGDEFSISLNNENHKFGSLQGLWKSLKEKKDWLRRLATIRIC